MNNISLLDKIKEVAKTGILPDGDHIIIPTQLWLEDLIIEEKEKHPKNNQPKTQK